MITTRDSRVWPVVVFLFMATFFWYVIFWWYELTRIDDPVLAWQRHPFLLLASEVALFAAVLGWSRRKRYSLVWPLTMFVIGIVYFCIGQPVFAISYDKLLELLIEQPTLNFEQRGSVYFVSAVMQISSICFARVKTFKNN